MTGHAQPLNAVAAAHARVSPSSLHRIRICAASLQMQEAFPHLPWENEEASAEGTCAHWVLAVSLTTARLIGVGELDPAGTPVTDEMLDAVDLAVDAIDALLIEHGKTRADLRVEQRLSIPRIHPSCWGTPDVWFVGLNGVIVVIDFKFGFRFVSEFENEQLVAYTVGAMGEADVFDTETRCVNVIIQPRAYGKSSVRSWAYWGHEVRSFVNVMANAVDRALDPNPTATVTPEGCRDCRARHACPTFQLAGQDAMAYTGQPHPLELPPAALSTEVMFATRQLKLLKARVEGLSAQGDYLAKHGATLPHHVLKPSRSSTVWNLPDEQVIALGKGLGVNLAKRPAAVTPKQALEKGLHDALLPALATTRPGALVLVEDDGSTARRVFGAKERA